MVAFPESASAMEAEVEPVSSRVVSAVADLQGAPLGAHLVRVRVRVSARGFALIPTLTLTLTLT